MSYRIKKNHDFLEVELWGQASKWDVIQAVGDLFVLDPRKELPDLWTVAEGCVIPLADYPEIVDRLNASFQRDITCRKSAIVATSAMQLGLAQLYKAEAHAYPFEMRVFACREDALAWFRDEATVPGGPGPSGTGERQGQANAPH